MRGSVADWRRIGFHGERERTRHMRSHKAKKKTSIDIHTNNYSFRHLYSLYHFIYSLLVTLVGNTTFIWNRQKGTKVPLRAATEIRGGKSEVTF